MEVGSATYGEDAMAAADSEGAVAAAYGLKGLTGTSVALAAALIVLAAIQLRTSYERRRYPPGPSWLEAGQFMIGGGGGYLAVREKWRRRFGHLYTLFLGQRQVVTLTSYEAIHDAFVRHADVCSSRPKGFGFLITGGDSGVVTSPHYKEQRKFALTVLREQGMGKIDMEHKIREEIRPFINEIEACNDEPIDVKDITERAVSNIICNLILGSRFEYNDPVFVLLLNRLLNSVKYLKRMFTIHKMPFLKWLPGDILGYHRYIKEIQENLEFFRDAIRKHQETLDPENLRDFIDAFIVEMKAQASGNSTSKSFDEENCISTVVQLFVAGSETTANTLLWAWLLMLLNQDIQKKVQSEIDRCIGTRPPTLSDKAHMPYTEAVLTEVMRLGNTAAASLPHIADAPAEVCSRLIPAGSHLVASYADVHLDEKTYPDPMAFKPERFIDHSGGFAKPRNFMPFGIGRRSCIGESLARAELFLFFVSVLQKFHVLAPSGSSYSTESELDFVLHPMPYKVIFKNRLITKSDMH